MARTAKPHFIVAIDFGGSRTKVIYQHRSGQPQLLTMRPEAFITTKDSIEQYGRTAVGQMCQMQGMNSFCWVQPLDKNGQADNSKVGTVGHLGAQMALFNSLNVAKSEKALYKLLGVLWVVQQKLIEQGYKIPDDFRVSIGALLPPNEANSLPQFQGRVEAAVAQGFVTPTGVLRPQLWGLSCHPEGLGLAQAFLANNPKCENATVFMLGHRNASAVLIRDRQPKFFRASDLGFKVCLDMLHGTHGVSAERLMEAVFEAREKNDLHPYYQATSYSDPELKDAAAEDLRVEFNKANKAYYQRLKNWVDDVLSDDKSTAIAFCGGGTNALGAFLNPCRPDLKRHLGVGVKLPSSIEVGPRFKNRLEDVYSTLESMRLEANFPKPEFLQAKEEPVAAGQ